MLSSLGAGCVAAFLVRRAEASDHTKWACGYAIINWIQAMLGSLGMTLSCGWGLQVWSAAKPIPSESTLWYFGTCIVPIAAVSRCRFLDADTHRFTAGSLGAIFESELPQ